MIQQDGRGGRRGRMKRSRFSAEQIVALRNSQGKDRTALRWRSPIRILRACEYVSTRTSSSSGIARPRTIAGRAMEQGQYAGYFEGLV